MCLLSLYVFWLLHSWSQYCHMAETFLAFGKANARVNESHALLAKAEQRAQRFTSIHFSSWRPLVNLIWTRFTIWFSAKCSEHRNDDPLLYTKSWRVLLTTYFRHDGEQETCLTEESEKLTKFHHSSKPQNSLSTT